MKGQHRTIFLLFFLLSAMLGAQEQRDSVWTAEEEYFEPQLYDYEDGIYKEGIGGVQFYIDNVPLSYPFVSLVDPVPMVLTFDEFGDDVEYYGYKLIHCYADWTPSDLDPFDYIKGFTEESINDYQFSFNTYKDYVSYRMEIPNEQMQITKSGNYLLVVFDENDPDDIILTRRFHVFEELVQIRADILQPNNHRYRWFYQELDFEVDLSNRLVINQLMDIKVTILQNGRWDNAMQNIQPTFLRQNTMTFHLNNQNLFKAGKEFRHFDIRSFRQTGPRVADVYGEEGQVEVELTRDNKKSHMYDKSRFDLNGRYLVARDMTALVRADADYAKVHFTYSTTPLQNGNIYLYGAVTDWKIDPKYQLKYNYDRELYEGSALLKQGIYNYQYVVVRDGISGIDDQTLEGSYYDTENDYVILVYHREFNARYDRLIGVSLINSRN